MICVEELVLEGKSCSSKDLDDIDAKLDDALDSEASSFKPVALTYTGWMEEVAIPLGSLNHGALTSKKNFSEDIRGGVGWKKRGQENLTKDTPPKRALRTPFVWYVSTPLRCYRGGRQEVSKYSFCVRFPTCESADFRWIPTWEPN